MITRSDQSVNRESITGVDPELVASCQIFRDCPRVADWMFVYPGISNTICEHHRVTFTELMRDVAKLDVNLLRFVRI